MLHIKPSGGQPIEKIYSKHLYRRAQTLEVRKRTQVRNEWKGRQEESAWEEEDSFVFPFSEEDDTSGFSILSELDEILAKISSFADVESLQAVNAKENSAETVRLAAAFVKLFIYYLLWGDKVEIFSLLNHNR